MSKRKEHTFRFTAGKIAEGAASEAKYHDDKAIWWNGEYEKAAAEAQKKGVEIRHYPVTGGNRAQVVIDGTVQNRLEEAARKRSDHQSKADRYKVEAAAYGSQAADIPYDLDGDDVMYFRLAGGKREDEQPTPYV